MRSINRDYNKILLTKIINTRKIAVLIVLCLFAFVGTAQIRIYKSDPEKQITLYGSADSLTLISLFGTPSSYSSRYDEYNDGQTSQYKYDGLIFEIVNNSLINFVTDSPIYPIRILDNYTARVGDPIEDFIRKTSEDAYFRMRGKDMLMFLKHDGAVDDLPLVFSLGADGKITSIWFSN